MLVRKAQIAVAEESVEGTAETLVAADATMLCYDPTFEPTISLFTRSPARATLSQLGRVIGKQLGRIGWKSELKGSGAVATAPAWDDAIRACGFARSVVSTIAIGAVTDGPLLPGETITGATSGGTGRVVGEVRTGMTPLPYVVVSGALQSGDVITGGTSGATATASSSPSATKGFEYRPASSSIPSATVGLFVDGMLHQIVGARGNVRVAAKLGEPVMLEFEFTGIYSAVTDTALLTSVPYESTVPIAFLNTEGSIGSLAAIYSTLSIDMRNELVDRESARSPQGALSVLITGRSPTASMDPEMELVADHDFYGFLIAGTMGRLYSELSGPAGEKITIGAPRIQYSTVGRGERTGIAIAALEVDLIAASETGGDDEFQIGMM